MNNWTNEIINRLDTAYNARFEKEKSLVFLNDAYQNLLFLKLKYTIDEDDEYGANNIRPGLTGWAQINGRDELEIDEKAKLDGYYVEHMTPLIDLKCFFGTFISVAKSEGVVEGGTGQKGQ